MDNNQSNELRDKILNDIKPLIVNDIEDNLDKFDALAKIIQLGGASYDLYKNAYETAAKIEDNNEKKEALMMLLDLIDNPPVAVKIDDVNNADTNEQEGDQ